jgi:hypothetical protein
MWVLQHRKKRAQRITTAVKEDARQPPLPTWIRVMTAYGTAGSASFINLLGPATPTTPIDWGGPLSVRPIGSDNQSYRSVSALLRHAKRPGMSGLRSLADSAEADSQCLRSAKETFDSNHSTHINQNLRGFQPPSDTGTCGPQMRNRRTSLARRRFEPMRLLTSWGLRPEG